MLETLADNRDLQPNLDEAQSMLTEMDVKKTATYQRGMQQGDLAGRLKVARQLLDILDDKTISAKTELPLEDIRKLREDTLH